MAIRLSEFELDVMTHFWSDRELSAPELYERIGAARGVAGVANVSVNVTSKIVPHAVQRGVQLLPKDWIGKTRVSRGRSRWGSDREYGYGFWIRQLAGHDSYYAWGYGGQFIFIVPSLQLVVVTTSRVDVSSERRDHLGAIYDLVELQVIPALAGSG